MTDTSAKRILVWDLPTRIFHWTLAGSFAGAWLTAESERLALLHMGFGFTLLGLIAFRVLWGFAGTRYARFREFLAGPGAVVRYLKSLVTKHPEHHVGHNPAGALAIVLLLLLGVATALSGFAYYSEIGGEFFEEVHEAMATAMLAIVFVHVAGVIVASVLHRENLVASMLSGFKRGLPTAGIPSSRPLVALILVAMLGGFWTYLYSPASFLRGGEAERVASTDSSAMSAAGDTDEDDD